MGKAFTFNALSGQFDIVDSGGLYWLDPVANFAALPSTDPDGAARVVRSENAVYVYNVGSLSWIFAGEIKTSAIGSAPNANGYSVATNNTLTLQPADGTNGGLVTSGTQTIGGAKTFNAAISASNLSGTNTGDVTLGAIGSSPNNNGASLSGQVLTLQPTDGTHGGILNTGSQTIAGLKTFSSGVSTQDQTSVIGTQDTVQFYVKGNGTQGNDIAQVIKSDNTVLVHFTNGGAITASGAVTGSNLSGTNTGDQTITLTSDVTGSGVGSFATTVAKIAGTTVSGTTGSTNVVFSSAPTLTNPIVGTQTQADNSTKAASTAYVDTAVSGYVKKSSGDINETSFAAANNQVAAADITGLLFSTASVRAANILLSVYVNATASLYEFFNINIIQKGTGWYISQTSTGDVSGFVFTITNAGQLQYVDSNYSGFVSAAVRFRSLTVSV